MHFKYVFQLLVFQLLHNTDGFTSSVMYISSVNPRLGSLTLTQYSTRQPRQARKGKGKHWQGSIGQDIPNPNI